MREYATTNSDRLLSRGGLLSRHSEVSLSSIRHRRNIRVTPSSIKHHRSTRGSPSSISHHHNIRGSPSSIKHHRSIRVNPDNIKVSHHCTKVILILWLSHIRISSTDSLRIRISRSIGKLRLHSTGRHHHHRSTTISRLKRDRLSNTKKRKETTRYQSSCSG